MSENYLYEYAGLLERILSFAYAHKYSSSLVERGVSYSPFFQKIERSHIESSPIETEEKLIDDIFGSNHPDSSEVPSYNQCAWAAESYIRIQAKSHLCFECLFLYMPIQTMYSYFPLYHEMDFSAIIAEFERLFKEKTALSILASNYGYTLKEVALKTSLPYDSVYSVAKRRRLPSKASFDMVSKLSSFLNVRPETIAEIEM
jgi:hypothetical protein